MTTLQEALPCPFCGSSEGLDYSDGSTHRWGVASCVSCGASAGETRREYPDVGEWHYAAMTQWNTRSALAQQGQEPVAIIEIVTRGNETTIDNHFMPCVRSWPNGEYKLYAAPAPQAQPTDPVNSALTAPSYDSNRG